MTMTRFHWRGEPIDDIQAWAAERGEPMVRYHAERTVPNILTGQLTVESYDSEMPESFWNTLRHDEWTYTRTDDLRGRR